MTTRVLIEMLQEQDPSGELPVFDYHGQPYFVQRLPYYYDGIPALIIHNENTGYYSPISAKFVDNGDKIIIESLSLEDLIMHDPDFEIDTSGLNDRDRNEYDQAIEEFRQCARNTNEFIEEIIKNGPPYPKCDNYTPLKYTIINNERICFLCGNDEHSHTKKTEES